MKSIWSKLIIGITTLLLTSTLIFSTTNHVIGQEVPPAIDVGPDGVLFAIGVVDNDRSEFQLYDWEGIKEYECTVGVNCETKKFPAHLLRMSAADRYDYLGVAQVTINFNLKQAYENVFLRIARADPDTTIVKLDDSVTHSVTSAMLGSVVRSIDSSKSGYGSYDLDLGSLNAGVHKIKLTIDEGGIGHGRSKWDAIILLVK